MDSVFVFDGKFIISFHNLSRMKIYRLCVANNRRTQRSYLLVINHEYTPTDILQFKLEGNSLHPLGSSTEQNLLDIVVFIYLFFFFLPMVQIQLRYITNVT